MGAQGRVSARSLYLRASSSFSTGLYLITHSGAPGVDREMGSTERFSSAGPWA